VTCENCAATLAELTTERDRLREALEKIVKLAADREAFMLLGPRAFAQAERIARAALAPDTLKENIAKYGPLVPECDGAKEET
jgi:hypothetical protein